MITSLRLQNFRGFDDHRVPLQRSTIIVGANNAGKSTVVEGLRLIAVATDRFLRGNSHLVRTPSWLDIPVGPLGLSPSVRGLTSDGLESTLFHQYGDPPAIITAEFGSGAQIVVYIGPGLQVHAVARHTDGTPISSIGEASSLGLHPIAAQPQVAPLLREEPIRTDATIRRGEGTYLASQHFRNQLWRDKRRKPYRDFRRIAEESWPQLQIKELRGHADRRDEPLQLLVRDRGFVGEVSLMGHGLQMWLQIVWFLARAPRNATVVLDEPDVYMHPDLQRRLLTLVRSRFAQLLIATHSIEIISDVDPRSILAVDRRLPESEFVAELPGLQQVMDNIGSVQNIQLTRLISADSFLLVEGADMKLLRILQGAAKLTGPPIDLVPHAEMGGRGGWRSGVAERLPSKNGEGQRILAYGILDSDYFPADDVAERYEEARRWGVQLRIWSRKEIENYLLVPGAIARFIIQEAPDCGCTAEQVAEQIELIVETLRRDPIEESMAEILYARNKSGGITTANRAAHDRVAESWASRGGRWAIAPGKKVMSQLSAWSKREFDVSFGPEQIARCLEESEVDREVAEVITAITESRNFQGVWQMPKARS